MPAAWHRVRKLEGLRILSSSARIPGKHTEQKDNPLPQPNRQDNKALHPVASEDSARGERAGPFKGR